MLSREGVNVRGEGRIERGALLAQNVRTFTRRSLLLLPRLDAVEANRGPRQSRDRRLEVSFATLRLAHLSLVQRLVVVHLKIVVSRPEAALTGLARLSELSVRLQASGRVLRFVSAHLGTRANHLGHASERILDSRRLCVPLRHSVGA